MVDQVAAHRVAAGRTHVGVAVEEERRLFLQHRIVSRRQVAELILAAGIGAGRGNDRARGVQQADHHSGQRGRPVVDVAIVAVTSMYVAADRGAQQFAEVVVLGVEATGQHGAQNCVAGVHCGAAGRAGRIESVEIAVGLNFANAIGARLQSVETVESVGVGRRRGAGGNAGGVLEDQRDVGDRRFGGVAVAVVVGVVVDRAADAGGRDFAKVVVDSVDARAQHDVADLIVGQRAAGRADVLVAVKISPGLHFAHAERSRRQRAEHVAANRVRQRGVNHVARRVEQLNRHAGQGGRVGRVFAIASRVHVNVAADADWQHFAEVVAEAVDVAGQRNCCDFVRSVELAAGRSDMVVPLQPSRRLVFQHGIDAGRQVVEAVVSAFIGGGGANDPAVGVEQVHDHARDAGRVGVGLAVAGDVVADVARDRVGQRFGKVVADAVFVCKETDGAEHVGRGDDAPQLAVDRAHGGPNAEISIRLGLDHAVLSGGQVVELVKAVGIGKRRGAGGDIVGAVEQVERQRNAADALVG